jgi:hypothetical protein
VDGAAHDSFGRDGETAKVSVAAILDVVEVVRPIVTTRKVSRKLNYEKICTNDLFCFGISLYLGKLASPRVVFARAS